MYLGFFGGGYVFGGARKFALQGVSSRENGRELADGKGGDSEVGGSMERGIWMGGQRSGACGGCDGVGVRDGEGGRGGVTTFPLRDARASKKRRY